jgi:hypothetical protein
MWKLIENLLTYLNQKLSDVSEYFFKYHNQWLNLVLLFIILLFLPHILCGIDFILKCMFYIGKTIYLIINYYLFQKNNRILIITIIIILFVKRTIFGSFFYI